MGRYPLPTYPLPTYPPLSTYPLLPNCPYLTTPYLATPIPTHQSTYAPYLPTYVPTYSLPTPYLPTFPYLALCTPLTYLPPTYLLPHTYPQSTYLPPTCPPKMVQIGQYTSYRNAFLFLLYLLNQATASASTLASKLKWVLRRSIGVSDARCEHGLTLASYCALPFLQN